MIQIQEAEHGMALNHVPADRIPAATAAARALGLRSQHYGWPGLTRTHDGALLVAASERILHVDPFGREVVARSEDDGRTWSAPQVVHDSPLDDRDANLCTLPDGTIVLTWFVSLDPGEWSDLVYIPRPLHQRFLSSVAADWRAREQAVSREVDAYWTHGGWLKRSHDGGRTWEEETYRTPIGQHAGPTVLHDGDLIQVGRLGREQGGNTGYVAARSDDGGKTWDVTGVIPCDRAPYKRTTVHYPYPLSAFNESHALECIPGRIIAMLRPFQSRNLHLTESDDGGYTWTEPRDLGIYGFPPHLLRLQAGPILCTYSARKGQSAAQPEVATPPSRNQLRAVLSSDEGHTWAADRAMKVLEMPYHSDFGYPVSLEIAPGEILTVYYSVAIPGQDPAADQTDPGESGIRWVRWRLPEAVLHP